MDLDEKRDAALETDADRQYRENLSQGRDKFKTLREIRLVPNFGESRSQLEAIIKALISKLSRSSILKTPNCLHPIHNFQPDSSLSKYLNFHMCLHDYLLI